MGILALAALAALTGWYFTGSLLATPTSVATIDLHATTEKSFKGQNAIELAFWLAVLGGNLLSFRTMEVFFRQGFGRFVRDFPLLPRAVFLNRFRHSLMEGAILAFVGTAFFLPLFFHNALAASAGIVTLVTSLLVAVPLSIAAFLYVGTVMSDRTNLVADAYGGGGGAFIYGPILGFAVVAFTCLGIKLGAGELLFRGGFSNAFFFIFVIVLLISAFAFKSAYYRFGKHYYLLLAKFNEADSSVFDLGNHYQTSDYPGKSKLAALAAPVGALARNYQLQYRRRFPVQRSIEKISLVALILFFATRESGSIPFWGVTLSGTLIFGALSNPWFRISTLPGRYEFISTREISAGKAKLAFVDVLPYSIVSASIPALVLLLKFGINTSIAYAGIAGTFAILNLYLVSQINLFDPVLTRYFPPLIIGLSVGLVAFFGPFVGAILSGIFGLILVGKLLSQRKPSVQTN